MIIGFLLLTSFGAMANDNTYDSQNIDQATVSTTQQVAQLVNKERTRRGLKPLAGDTKLSSVASGHAKDMYSQSYFSHQSLDGRTMTDRMEDGEINYHYAGENIAWGQTTAQKVMSAWMNSPGHRRNILNPRYRKIGIARAGNYWVQDFTD